MIRKKIFRKSIVKLGANNNKQSDKMKYWSRSFKSKEHSSKCKKDVTWLYHFSYLVNKNLKSWAP